LATRGGGLIGVSHPEIAYSREMGLTHDDFWRLLPRAMGENAYEIQGNSVHAKVHGGSLEITLGDLQVRRIALLRLPFAVVSFHFNGIAEQDQQAFKAHFDLHFQRGGG
jgi:hypothetical protein